MDFAAAAKPCLEMNMDLTVIPFILVGFFAQIVDGCLGMAYGVSASTFLLGLGVSPAVASASVHTAEVFTTGVSGLSHWRLGNIDKDLIKRLLLPGVLGGILGAYLLTNLPGDKIKPFVSLYLVIMGVRILIKAFRPHWGGKLPLHLGLLGLVAGFFDAVGGGGWGPIATTTLIANGKTPRETIGSVNLTEFFVTLAEALTFVATIGLVQLQVILGLIIGGVVAAPLGAVLTRRISAKWMMVVVGLLIIGLSLQTIFQAVTR